MQVRKSFHLMVTFALLCSSSGCLTGQMWAAANEPTTHLRAVSTVPGGRMLVVRYEVGDERSTLMIPLTTEGSPVAPFAYSGNGRTESDILSDIKPDQRAAILKATGEVTAGDGPVTPVVDQDAYLFDHSTGLVVISYRFENGGLMLEARPERQPITGVQVGTENQTEPPRVAIVPAERPRPAEVRQRTQFVAAALTPLTIPADAVLLGAYVVVAPPLYLYLKIFWPNGGC